MESADGSCHSSNNGSNDRNNSNNNGNNYGNFDGNNNGNNNGNNEGNKAKEASLAKKMKGLAKRKRKFTRVIRGPSNQNGN